MERSIRIGVFVLLAHLSAPSGAAETSVIGVYRYTTESAFNNISGSALVDGKAYLNDYAIGADARVSGAGDGDRWTWVFRQGDSVKSSSASLTFHEEYDGRKNCFVSYLLFHYPQVWCGTTSTWHEVAYKSYCRTAGNWSVDIRYTPGDGSPEQLIENPLEIVSTGPEVDVATASNRIRPEVIGGGGIPNLSAGSTGVKVEVNDSGCPNRPLPDADITIETRTVAGSGGHTHMGKQAGTGSFPSGSATETGITNEEGVFQTEYTAGVAGLREQIIATARTDVSAESEPPNVMEGTGETELTIAIPDLVPLTPSSDYELYQSPTGQDTHRQNNYGTLGLVSILQSVAKEWIEKQLAQGLPISDVRKMSFNDMSLPNGGVFDLCQSLQANCDHVSHEVGVDVDVNVQNRMVLNNDEADRLIKLFDEHKPSCRFIHKYHFRCDPALSVY